jgi:polygalacturonase
MKPAELFLSRPNRRTVLECGGRDTALVPADVPGSDDPTASKAVSRFACHRTPGRKRGIVDLWTGCEVQKSLPLLILLLANAVAGCKSEGGPAAPKHSVFNVRDFGATGDGTNKDTAAFQKAFDTCASRGGGEVVVPPGNYLIGSVQMGGHTTLKLQKGSVITGSRDMDDYPMTSVRWEGRWEPGHRGLIYSTNADDVIIAGPGLIEGSPKVAAPQNPRGAVVLEFASCRGVRWENFSITQGGNWATHPVYCSDVVISNVTIIGRRDGIDVDSCRHVVIADCNINTGDDSISIKSGRGAQAAAIGRPTDDVVISGCTLADRHFACIGIGSETSGGIRNVRIVNCRFTSNSYGIYIKTRIGRGGVIENISGDDLDVLGGGFLRVNLASAGNSNTADDPVPGLAGYPQGKKFSFSNVRLTNVTVLADVSKIALERPLDGFTLSNITGTCSKGISLANIVNAKVSNIHVTGFAGELMTETNVQGAP